MAMTDNGPSPIWRPFTQMEGEAPVPAVRSGEGAVLHLEDGRSIVDCIASWWVTLHGHAQPEIAAAVSRQAHCLEQVIAAGFTHQPAEELARRLVDKLPAGLTRLFYSDNGSTAVEVALKLAVQYWRNQGQGQRRRFLSFEGAYHGDTVGAMSVSGRSLFSAPFANMLFEVDYAPYPYTWSGDGDIAAREQAALARVEELLEGHGEEYAGVVIEPLVQGAGGMRLCRPEFLRCLEGLARSRQILVIYDEVMVGFGRTGDWFACGRAGTNPDLICLSKGLTGGFLPMAVTGCSEAVYRAFWGEGKTFYHGHSYTANPLGCAAALASMELLDNNWERLSRLEGWHRQGLKILKATGRFRRLRLCGTIAAADIAVGDGGYLHWVGPVLRQRFLERGFLLRPLGNVIYLLPPYCIEGQQLEAAYLCIADEVERLAL